MADPREDKEILLNMIHGSAEEGHYDDREGDENPEGIDDGSQYLVDPNDQENVGEVYNICSLLCLYT
jgi:hypothetical protein